MNYFLSLRKVCLLECILYVEQEFLENLLWKSLFSRIFWRSGEENGKTPGSNKEMTSDPGVKKENGERNFREREREVWRKFWRSGEGGECHPEPTKWVKDPVNEDGFFGFASEWQGSENRFLPSQEWQSGRPFCRRGRLWMTRECMFFSNEPLDFFLYFSIVFFVSLFKFFYIRYGIREICWREVRSWKCRRNLRTYSREK